MNRSESIKELAASLAKFQAEIKNPKTTAKNPQFSSKYSPLDVILETVRPVLGKHGLSIIQNTGGGLENITISTMLLHSSGEWIESDSLNFKGEQTLKGGGTKLSIQGAGSCITYGRRYQVTAILGLAGNDDDDGNNASSRHGHDKDETGEEELTFEEASKTILPFSKQHKGKTLIDIYENHPEWVAWYLREGTDAKIKSAFEAIDKHLHAEMDFEKPIDATKIATIKGLLEKTDSSESDFLKFYKLERLEDMTMDTFTRAMKALEKKLEKTNYAGTPFEELPI
jgi:hypothetical protein